MQAIDDMTASGFLAPGEVSERSLKDGIGSNKGLIDVLNLKHDLRSYVLQFDLEARVRDAQSKNLPRKALSSFANYRELCAPLQGLADRTWMSEMPTSTKALVNVYEEAIYGSDYDPTIRAAARMSMSIPELLKQTTLAGAFAGVEAILERENMEARLANKGSATAEPSAEEVGVASKGAASSGADEEARLVKEEVNEAHWQKLAMLKISENVNFVIDPGKSEASVSSVIESTRIGQTMGDTRGHCLLVYDVTLAGESVTAPHLRSAPFRKDHVAKFINAALTSRKLSDTSGNACRVAQGDVYYFYDGGKTSIAEAVNRLFVAGKGRFGVLSRAERLTKIITHLCLTEDSLKKRRCLTRGVASLRQLQSMHFFANQSTTIPEKGRIYYPGTNLGNVLTNVSFEDWQDAWKLTLDEKKALYGPENRKPVGGRSDGTVPGENEDDESNDELAKVEDAPKFSVPAVVGAGRGSGLRPGTEVEPVFWFQFPVCFFRELLSSCFAKQVIDFTPGSGNCALAALDHGTGYLGFCFNEEHRKQVLARLANEVLSRMRDEGSTMYNAAYATWYAGGETTPTPNASGKAKAKAAPKPRAKNKGAKPESSQAGSGSLAALLNSIDDPAGVDDPDADDDA